MIVTTEFIVCFLRIVLVRKSIDYKRLLPEHLKYVVSFLITLVVMRYIHFGQSGTFLNLAITSIIATAMDFVLLLALRTRLFDDLKKSIQRSSN
ncbi:hypothetical protein ACFQ4R_07230 [Lapidilactobacillus gannanensis]|uniref:Uncharacterized protein n=1 Tax=Lapidilactobacillus gannanensis TaxID=2486002 RepID=A0ABW4BMC9_9LACO